MSLFPFSRPPRLEEYFAPLSGLELPDPLLFIGSGGTRAPSAWHGIPSVRINARTLDLFPENPVYAVICQILSTPKVLRHPLFSDELGQERPDSPWAWQFLNELSLERSRRPGFKAPREKFIRVGTSRLAKTAEFSTLDTQFTTGSLIVLFLLYARVKRIYVAGYDGYLGEKYPPQANGKPWPGWKHGHDLSLEWSLIERSIETARAGGKEVLLAVKPGCDYRRDWSLPGS